MAADHTDNKDLSRRNFLIYLSGAVGLVGVGFSAVPFIRSMSPTKDILAAGVVEEDISGLKDGELRTIIWRKQPVFILRRTTEMIDKDSAVNPADLSDPATPEDRAKRPDLFVSIGICTHLGCIPKFVDRLPDTDRPGFYCPCHGGKYDTMGRRLAGPPPENLHLVPYEIVNGNKLVIGSETFAGYGDNVRKLKDLPKV